MMFTAIIVLLCLAMPRIPQPQSYHLFADGRTFLGIANFGNVMSNLPFAVIGLWGLMFLLRTRSNLKSSPFIDEREVWPYSFAFGGLFLTAFGSSFYHLAPDNARLVWDRLPMAVTFMSMVAAIITERINVRLGLTALPILLLVGLVSVLDWYWREIKGAGDLRFYIGVQAYSAMVILLALFLPRRYTRGSYFGLVLGFYALAKVLELFDRQVFGAFQVVSGHTLKHIAAATAGYCILRMLQKRKPVGGYQSHLGRQSAAD
jgi:hypothetical protein